MEEVEGGECKEEFAPGRRFKGVVKFYERRLFGDGNISNTYSRRSPCRANENEKHGVTNKRNYQKHLTKIIKQV